MNTKPASRQVERKQTIKVKNVGQKHLLVRRSSKVKWLFFSRIMALLTCAYEFLSSLVLTFYLSQSWDYYETQLWNIDKLLTSWSFVGFFINTLIFPFEDNVRINPSPSVHVSKWRCCLLSEMHALMGSIKFHLNQGCLVGTWCMKHKLLTESSEQDSHGPVYMPWTGSGTHR